MVFLSLCCEHKCVCVCVYLCGYTASSRMWGLFHSISSDYKVWLDEGGRMRERTWLHDTGTTLSPVDKKSIQCYRRKINADTSCSFTEYPVAHHCCLQGPCILHTSLLHHSCVTLGHSWSLLCHSCVTLVSLLCHSCVTLASLLCHSCMAHSLCAVHVHTCK